MIETIKGNEIWENYRFIKVPSVISYDDLWSGKGTEPIYTIENHGSFVASSQVRERIEALNPHDFEFSQPILLGQPL